MEDNILLDVLKLDDMTLTSLKILLLFITLSDANGLVRRLKQVEISEKINISRSLISPAIQKLINLDYLSKKDYDYYVNLKKLDIKKN